jgi:hypothetical protein
MHIAKANVRSRRARQAGVGTAAALLTVSLVGCDAVDLKTVEPHGLGNPCVVSGAALQSRTALIVGPDDVNCSSHVCLRPELEMTTDTDPLCTQGCETDLDCQDGQRRNLQDSTDRRCTSGFSCEVPVPNLESVPLACQKVCVCRDFLVHPMNAKPPSCP